MGIGDWLRWGCYRNGNTGLKVDPAGDDARKCDPQEPDLETKFIAAEYCANCCFRQDPPLPAGQTICDECASNGANQPWEIGAHERRAKSALARTKTAIDAAHWLLEESLRNGWLNADSSLQDVRAVVEPLWIELGDRDRKILGAMLTEKISPEPDTFEMLVRWSRSRLATKQRRMALGKPRSEDL